MKKCVLLVGVGLLVAAASGASARVNPDTQGPLEATQVLDGSEFGIDGRRVTVRTRYAGDRA